MNIIFRQVKTKERTPKESGSYLTYNGYKWFSPDKNIWTDFCPSPTNDNQTAISLQYWLEPVELPTDEEIEKEAMKIDSQEEIHDYYNHGKMVGMKWMRRFVLAVTPNEVQK